MHSLEKLLIKIFLKYLQSHYDLEMEARFAGFNSHAVGGQQRQQHQQHFAGSTFPETFKDFFSMTNEDEDQIELISSLEDKVRKFYNI